MLWNLFPRHSFLWRRDIVISPMFLHQPKSRPLCKILHLWVINYQQSRSTFALNRTFHKQVKLFVFLLFSKRSDICRCIAKQPKTHGQWSRRTPVDSHPAWRKLTLSTGLISTTPDRKQNRIRGPPIVFEVVWIRITREGGHIADHEKFGVVLVRRDVHDSFPYRIRHLSTCKTNSYKC